MNKKYLVTIAVTAFVLLGIAATKLPDGKYKNLKVLPADISEKKMNSIMIDEFEDALGVSCTFCHAKEKDSEKLDYASDENPMKENTREMMRMAIGINEKYFNMNHPMIGDSLLRVTCVTCHHGEAYPGQ